MLICYEDHAKKILTSGAEESGNGNKSWAKFGRQFSYLNGLDVYKHEVLKIFSKSLTVFFARGILRTREHGRSLKERPQGCGRKKRL